MIDAPRKLWKVRITYEREVCIVERQIYAPDAPTAVARAAALNPEEWSEEIASAAVEEATEC